MPDGQTLLGFLKQCNALTPNVFTWKVEIEQAAVKPQIDLLAQYNWKPVVIDWKLSRSYLADYSRQLIICGLVVFLKRLENKDKQPYAYEDIQLFEVNLFKRTVKQHEFTEERANDMIDEINLTSRDILLLRGEDEEPDIDDFEGTPIMAPAIKSTTPMISRIRMFFERTCQPRASASKTPKLSTVMERFTWR